MTYVLRMSVDPAYSDDFVFNLSLKELNLICHEAMILMTFLSRHNKSVYDESVISLTTC